MKWLFLAFLLCLPVSVYACSGSVVTAGSSDGGGDDSGGASSGAASSGGSNGGGTSGTSSGNVAPCSTTLACPSGTFCGFYSSGGCAYQQGQCFPVPGAVCQAYSPACACDGTEFNHICNGLPSGFDTKPIAGIGPCGQVDAGGSCMSDVQCFSGMKCCPPCSTPPACPGVCTRVPEGGACPR